MKPETLDAAMKDMEGLFQVAAVYKSWARNPEEEIINPSIIGGINALQAATKAGVKKVIFTSSTAAIGRSGPNGRALTEDDENKVAQRAAVMMKPNLFSIFDYIYINAYIYSCISDAII